MKRRLIATLTLSLLAFGGVGSDYAAANNARKVEAPNQDPEKMFAQMVSKLDAMVKKDSHALAIMEMDLPKIKKRVEMAGYRVAAARERWNEAQAKLPGVQGDEAAKLKQKLAYDHGLLKKDAVKLGEYIAKVERYRADMRGMVDSLKSLSDDVAIEADRFDPDRPRVKKATALVTRSEDILAKIDEMLSNTNDDLVQPIVQHLAKAHVSNLGAATLKRAAPGEFVAVTALQLQALQSATAAGRFVKVGELNRGEASCQVSCMIDDPTGIKGTSGDLQLRCTGDTGAGTNTNGMMILSRWRSGSPQFPAFSGIRQVPCGS